MGWFQSVLDTTESVGKWMENNPTAANILGGAAVDAATYYTQKEERNERQEQEERMYQRRRSDELSNSQASSGIGNYAQRNNDLVGGTGLLTRGKLTGQ